MTQKRNDMIPQYASSKSNFFIKYKSLQRQITQILQTSGLKYNDKAQGKQNTITTSWGWNTYPSRRKGSPAYFSCVGECLIERTPILSHRHMRQDSQFLSSPPLSSQRCQQVPIRCWVNSDRALRQGLESD